MSHRELVPYIGIGSIHFGMVADAVADVAGPPDSTSINRKNELEEYRGDLIVRFDAETNQVVELAVGPKFGVTVEGKDLYDLADPVSYLETKDPNPVECFGFVLFLNLGIALTGFHDQDPEQEAITVFKRHRWDGMADSFVPFEGSTKNKC